MKSIICYLAQKNFSSKGGAFANHVAQCPECEEFFDRVSTLESKLVLPAGEADLDLCSAILSEVSGKIVAFPPKPGRAPGFISPALLSGAVAAAVAFTAVLTVNHFKSSSEVAANPSVPVPPPIVDVPQGPPKEVSLAYVLEQQEFLRRDALRLGAHLREHSILFQAADQ